MSRKISIYWLTKRKTPVRGINMNKIMQEVVFLLTVIVQQLNSRLFKGRTGSLSSFVLGLHDWEPGEKFLLGWMDLKGDTGRKWPVWCYLWRGSYLDDLIYKIIWRKKCKLRKSTLFYHVDLMSVRTLRKRPIVFLSSPLFFFFFSFSVFFLLKWRI